MTDVPAMVPYTSVVSREAVQIASAMAEFNVIRAMAADIMNTYNTAPNKEKIWTLCTPKFGIDKGQRAIVVRALLTEIHKSNIQKLSV